MLRVLYVSTWGSQCGIATYTEELVEGSRGLWDSFVSGPVEGGSGLRCTPPTPFKQHWQRISPFLDSLLLQAVEEFGPDIVHVQHEHGLFQHPSAFLRAMRAIKKKVPVVCTLHTVNWTGGWEHSLWYRDLGRCVDRILVHLPEAMAAVGLYAPNTACIPHGTGPSINGDPLRGIEALHLGGELARLLRSAQCPTVCLLYGFIGEGKNLVGTVKAISTAIARRLCDPVAVLIVGHVHAEPYIRSLQWLLSHTGLELYAAICPEFVAAKDVPDIFALADFGVLNTTGWSLSASGAAHVFARYGVPLAVAQRPIYFEAARAGALIFDLKSSPEDPTDAAIAAIGALASNDRLRVQVGAEMSRWAEQTAWSIVARQHLALYERVVAERAVAKRDSQVEVDLATA